MAHTIIEGSPVCESKTLKERLNEMKKIYVFTTAGGKYLEWYEKYTLPSLQSDFKKLMAEGYKIDLIQNGFDTEGKLPTIEEAYKLGATSEIDGLILPGLRAIIQKCIDDDAILFLAPPDTIFAKDSMYNMVKLSENKNDCIALPHIRIAVGDYKGGEYTAKELINLAFEYPHSAFIDCFDNEEENATWAGISLRKLNDNVYSMIHNLPTVYLAKFNARDLEFWKNTPCWGNWDRGFLRSLFIENRVKVIGSSEMAFCVELTEKESNNPPKRKGLQYNDKYFSNDIHNNNFNKFIFTLVR